MGNILYKKYKQTKAKHPDALVLVGGNITEDDFVYVSFDEDKKQIEKIFGRMGVLYEKDVNMLVDIVTVREGRPVCLYAERCPLVGDKVYHGFNAGTLLIQRRN